MRSFVLGPALAGLALLSAPAAGAAGPTLVALEPADPCSFFRDVAWGQGIAHLTTEMLWACDAIADRNRAGIPLGARLEGVEAALARYQQAVAEGDADPAGASGARAALDAISNGF